MKKTSVEDLAMFMKVMEGLAEEFGGTLSKDNIKMRFNVLCGYSIDQIKDAASTIMQSREVTFPAVPTTKEIKDAIESRIKPKVSIGNMAIIQADIVLEKLKFYGRNAAIDFKDPITFHLMTRQWPYGSWAATVMSSELTWWKKEFIQAYEAYGEVEHEEAKLLGAPESQEFKELSMNVGNKL